MASVVAAGLAAMAAGLLDGCLAANRAGMEPLDGGTGLSAMALAALLLLPLGIAAGIGVWAFGATCRRVLPERLQVWLRTWKGIAALGALGLLGCAGLYLVASRLQIDWQAVDWRLALIGGSGAALYFGTAFALRRNWRWAVGAAFLLFGIQVGSAVAWSTNPDAHAEAVLRLGAESAASKYALRVLKRFLDADGDGFPTALCAAGCDCDDADPRTYPGAADTPGNGIDEDCSGEDATEAEAAEFADVFARPPPRPAAKKPEPAVKPGPAVEPGGAPGPSEPKPAVVEGAVEVGALTEPKPAAAKPQQPEPGMRLSRPGKKPNVLLIVVDTVRADHLGIYGYERDTSPRIDAWAKTGVVFEQPRSTGPSTRFSVVPMLTSKHFTEIERGRSEWPKIDDSETLLAERLDALGYITAAFHSIRYFREMYNIDQGFDHYSTKALDERGPPLRMVSADFITDEVLAWVDQTELKSKHEPFFLWAYYGDPHSQYVRHKGFKHFGPKYRDLYDHEIYFSDHHIGRLMDGLRERGLLEDTIVVLTSDHGEALDPAEDHGIKYHSKTLYDELIRVPLIISVPGIEPRRVATPVSLLDIAPTLIELAGADEVPEYRGVSLVPWLVGEDPPHPPVFFEKHRAIDDPEKGMIMWPYKIIVVSPLSHIRIFDLSKDPGEKTNIAKTMPEAQRDRLIGVFKHWATRVLKPTADNPRH